MSKEFLSKTFIDLIKVQDLRMIIALSEYRTILRAADAMGLSQPAITKRLQDLEKDLKISLFNRMSRGVEPTPYGDILIKHAHIVLNQIRHAEDEVSDLSDGSGGRINVGVPVGAATDLISKSISKLLEERKDVQITLVEDYNIKLVPLLKQGDIDLIIGRLPSEALFEDLNQEELYSEEIKVVVRNEHPLANKKNIEAKDLLGWKWMMPLRDSIMYTQLQSYFTELEMKIPDASIYSLSYVASLRVLKSRDLIAICPAESIRTQIENKYIKILDIKDKIEPTPVGIITRTDAFLSPAAKMFIETIKEQSSKV